MAVLPILTGADNPALRAVASPVPQVTKEVKALIKDMAKTVKSADGIGLAAPQIGQPIRLCLALVNGKMTPLINPKIMKRSSEMDVMEEGCLSLPDLNVDVPRSTSILLTYTDESGQEQQRELKDISARVVQHEVDHLDGILIVDYQAAE